MSLTSIIHNNKDFKALIKKIMPSRNFYFSNTQEKAFSTKNPILASYILERPGQANQVGTATDYVFRFVVAKYLKQNKEEVYKNMVAERGLLLLKGYADFPKYERKYNTYLEDVKQYVTGDDNNYDAMIEASVYFTRLEHLLRGGLTEDGVGALLDEIEEIILKDINNIVKVFENVFIKEGIVKPDSDVVFNPHFGSWGRKCSGADADIYIDGILYDFKCTKEVGYNWDEVGQVYAYYLLNLLCHADKDKDRDGAELVDKNIIGIAIYHSRYGLINRCFLSESDANNSAETLEAARKILNSEDEKNADMIVGALSKYSESFFKNMNPPRKDITPEEFHLKVGDCFDGGGLVGKGRVVEFLKKVGEWQVIVDIEGTGKVIALLSQGMKWKKLESSKVVTENTAKTTVRQTNDNLIGASLEYSIGDKVCHKTFGTGIVTNILKTNKDYEVTVKFDEVGIKRMIASYSHLEKHSK